MIRQIIVIPGRKELRFIAKRILADEFLKFVDKAVSEFVAISLPKIILKTLDTDIR